MSHPFCGTELACPPTFPKLGWDSWNKKAIYVHVEIDSSVIQREACGAAIEKWNNQAGARFYMTRDAADVSITFFEKRANEWPFTVWGKKDGDTIWGIALNYTTQGERLGINPGRIKRCEIYVNGDIKNKTFVEWINFFAHEIGHAFGLDDHPKEDINSVMSYQRQGRKLLAPSWEDVKGIAAIYGLANLDVRPEDLDGIENIVSMWHEDRYGKLRYLGNGWQRWAFWFARFIANGRSGASPNTLKQLVPYEIYWVKTRLKEGEGMLGFGRFSLVVLPGQPHTWEYR